jgi:predicted  nucleic acid-binding Zn-ribbon protein
VATTSVECTRCGTVFTAGRADAKYCPECGKVRARERFSKWAAKPGSDEKIREWRQRRRERHLVYARDWHYQDRFGMTAAEADAYIAGQGRRCGICSTPDDLVIDHCHDTGQLRGVLCRACNRALGLLGDTPEAIVRAIAYLAPTHDFRDGVPPPGSPGSSGRRASSI